MLGAGQIPARAKRVICLHMLGAISHVDTFDYKPTLVSMHGQDLPQSVRDTQRLSTMSGGQSAFPIVGPLRPFRQRGESGAWVSDFLPYTAAIADELCFVKSVHTEHVNHDPASKFLHTGFQLAGRPSAGAWVSYALGSDNRDLPNFVVMNSGVSSRRAAGRGDLGRGLSAVAPSGRRVPRGRRPRAVREQSRRHRPQRIAARCSTRSRSSPRCSTSNRTIPEILSRVSQYEMAYRMQSSVPEVADISDEPESRARDVRPRRAQARHVRAQLPHRAPARRARREVPDVVRHGLGSSPRDQAELPGALRRDRPAERPRSSWT